MSLFNTEVEQIDELTHLPLVPHIDYASVNWVSIGSGNRLSPVRRQAMTWTIACLLSIRLIGTNFSQCEIRIGILSISFKKNAFEIVVCKHGDHFCPGGDGWERPVNLTSSKSRRMMPWRYKVSGHSNQFSGCNILSSNPHTLFPRNVYILYRWIFVKQRLVFDTFICVMR